MVRSVPDACYITVVDWNIEQSDKFAYLTATVSEDDLEEAIAAWWSELMTRARACKGWDVVVADIWADTARLIGHVQSADDAIGMDRGFRVCLTVATMAEELHASEDSEDLYFDIQDALFEQVDRSLRTDAVRALLAPGPQKVWFCYSGELIADVTV